MRHHQGQENFCPWYTESRLIPTHLAGSATTGACQLADMLAISTVIRDPASRGLVLGVLDDAGTLPAGAAPDLPGFLANDRCYVRVPPVSCT
jgi:hypothetical protein